MSLDPSSGQIASGWSTVEVSQQLHLPRQVSVATPIAAPAEATDGELPVDAHAPHLVNASGSERFDPSDVVAPPVECLPAQRASAVAQIVMTLHSLTSEDVDQRSEIAPT